MKNVLLVILAVILIAWAMYILGPIPTILSAFIGFYAEDIVNQIKKVSKYVR